MMLLSLEADNEYPLALKEHLLVSSFLSSYGKSCYGVTGWLVSINSQVLIKDKNHFGHMRC